MDYKKVDSFVSYDENGVLIVDTNDNPIQFMAEFNNGSFAGDISAMTGTFSGVLTASAINAVSGVNIAGGAVAISASGFANRYPTSGACPEGQTVTVMQFSFNVPDTQGVALLRLHVTARTDGDWDSQSNFDYRQKILLNNVPIFTGEIQDLSSLYFVEQRVFFETVLPVTAGVNTVKFTHWTSNGDKTPRAYYENLGFTVDFVRK